MSALGAIAPVLPMAHLGHWLWIFYVLPVLIVIGGIIRSTRIEKRREKDRRPPRESR